MSAKQRDSAISAGSLAFLVSDWVDERFNLPACDLLDFGKEPDPAVAARTLRQHWGLGEKPIPSMLKLLEAKGVRVFSLAEQNKNVDAFSYWRDGRPFVFLNTFKTAEHSRFDAAHELGHLVMHRHGHAKGREAETEANTFASQIADKPRYFYWGLLFLGSRFRKRQNFAPIFGIASIPAISRDRGLYRVVTTVY